MTVTARELFEAGRLTDAIATLSAEVKAKPTDAQRRGFLAELLCFGGELERADRALDLLGDQEPTAALGVALFRQLLRGEQARRQVFAEGRVPELLGKAEPHVALRLRAAIAVREKRPEEAAQLLAEAEAARPALKGTCNGKPFDDFRDADDLIGGVFEVITSTGKYYWIPAERVVSIDFYPPARPRDLLWRRAAMTVADGPDGDVFIPAVYVPLEGAAAEERARLGRTTDWIGGDGAPVRGIGQRSYLVGDDDLTIMALESLEFEQAAGADAAA